MKYKYLHNRKSKINRSLLVLYKQHARTLPWRETHNPYRILISEVMLQQTQVSRVQQKYPEFLRKFPTIRALASARSSEIIRAWEGMGYNNRALRLLRLAVIVMQDYNGRLPDDPDVLESLPGIGKYTANAIACFAFGKQVPVVDTNVRRVFSRMLGKQINAAEEWECASLLLPRTNAYNWNQGLMELGALICSSANPQCSICPLKLFCRSSGKITSTKKYKSSASRKKIPDRIYRGKIISVLRRINARASIDSLRLLKKLEPKISQGRMEILLNGLREDGLIQIMDRNQKQYISLPK
jgi:A/G-specific adenine glycosylase